MEVLSMLWRYKSTLVFVLTPILLLPLPLVVPGKESACGYCIILMAIYWMTEVVPLAATSLIPLILFPMMGIMTAGEVSTTYLTDTNWLFIGGLMIATAVESTNLHRRISLRVLTLVGAKPRCLMFGFMITTFFLSMWISNTATTAMMLPIVEAVIKELLNKDNQNTSANDKREDAENGTTQVKCTAFTSNPSYQPQDELDEVFENDPATESEMGELEKDRAVQKQMEKKLKIGLSLCIPYAASIGGTVTLTGTGPNLVLSGQFDLLFPNATDEISFANWIAYCLPPGLLFFLCAYLWLSSLFLGFNFREMVACFDRRSRTKQEENVKNLLMNEYRKLGSITWAEATVLVVFITTALLWFFREPGFMPGWSVIFEDGHVDDGTVAISMAFLLFFLPSRKPMFLQRSNISGSASPVEPILKWSAMQKVFPWSVVFLLGGGFALAQGATVSGFSKWLGDQLSILEGIDDWLVCLIITIVLCVFTEVTSNVATATLFVPILAQLAQAIEIHPLYLLIPPILATSMAFMLPVATPPNAISFSYGHLKVSDMARAGVVLNIVGIAIVTIFINTYGVAFFGLNEFPDWAKPTNSSSTLISDSPS